MNPAPPRPCDGQAPGAHATGLASPGAGASGLAGHRAWAAFVRQELLGPLDVLGGLCEVLGQEAEGTRPDDYLADVAKLRQAAARLLELAGALLSLDDEATSTDLEEGMRRARHDLGNRLHQVSGMAQLLQFQEESLFGAFGPDLDRILELCHECEARLLQQGSGAGSDGPAAAGVSEIEIARVVDEIRPIEDEQGSDVPPGRVLIADDDPVNREVLRRLLAHQGHTVAEAGDGHEALRLLEEQCYDVLLLDILMPGLNGFQVLQRLRERGGPQRTSVIVVSSLDEVHSLVRCLEAGAEDYLTKPVNRVLLRARLNACLQKRRQRTRELEQFFPPEVVRQLVDRPEALRTGRTAEVSILFCDIRGFSRVSERLRNTPEKMVQWVSAVMEALDECVLRHQGVLVDFIGDELLAMWGAPQAQPDHARRACRAALDMLACVGRLSADWQGVIGEETAIGIGINSGPVSVGNTGTRRRFKYGPVGDTVNLASRLQGATKYLKARALITQSTRDLVGDEFAHRRLARLQVVNIHQPVTVYELAPAGEPGWEALKDGYEKALDLYEAGPEQLQEAARVLGSLVTPFGLGGPNLFLLSRILGAMQDRLTWSGVYVLPGK
jgi:adenylate cyclase